jgi:chemotaxis signal transduction protein
MREPTVSTSTPPRAPGGAPRSFVVFDIGSRRCAIELSSVIEVIPLGPVTPVPTAPTAVAGAVNVHGHVVAVLDLGLVLDGQPMAPREGDVSLLVRADETTVVLRVDRVRQVAPLDLEHAAESDDGAGLISRIVTADDRRVGVIDLQQLLHHVAAQIVADAPRATEAAGNARGAPLFRDDP